MFGGARLAVVSRFHPMAAALALVALVATGSAQQPQAPAPRTISGVVTTTNDVPLARVRVASATPDSRDLSVLTDARGQFTIRVTSANPRLTLSKAGYVPQTVDVPRARATGPADVGVRLSRGGALSGQVTDRAGARVMLAAVTARRAGAPASEPPLRTTTNDLGEFRFGGLAEGAYTVTARPPEFAIVSGPLETRDAVLDAHAVTLPALDVRTGTETSVTLSMDMPPSTPPGLAGRPIDVNPDSTGSLRGRVTGSDGLPIERATVMVYRANMLSRTVQTDDRGRYQVDRLSPGTFIVEARKPLYMDRQYGQTQSEAGRPIELRAGQSADSIDVTLTRGGVIAGTIVDEFGEPVQGIDVSPVQMGFVDGRRRAIEVSTSGQTRTDDRGQYRLFGLYPGTYLVRAKVTDIVSGEQGYAPVYYPGALGADQATPVRIDFGTAATSVDFTLTPTPTYRVTGAVVDSTGAPSRGGVVMLMVSERSGATLTEPIRALVTQDGSFLLPNIPPGDYVVQAARSVKTAGDPASGTVSLSRELALSYVTVTSGDPAPLRLQLSPGATLTGHIRYEGGQPDTVPRLTMNAVSMDADRNPLTGFEPMGLAIRPDGSFEYRGVFGPIALSVQPMRAGWYAKSASFRGQNLLDMPFDFGSGGTHGDIEVIIAANGASVSGRVTDDRAAPVPDYRVVVFSPFRDQWFNGSRWVRTAYATERGSFSVSGLPPGEYFVAALERGGEDPPPPDAALLESLSSRVMRITLGDGQSQDVTLRLTRR